MPPDDDDDDWVGTPPEGHYTRDRAKPELPSIGVSGEIHVTPERRQAFFDELQRTLQDLFTRYGGGEGDAFKLAVACYPKGDRPGE